MQRDHTIDDGTAVTSRIAWGAVLAGVAVALVVQLVVNMVGIGIGAATLDPGTTDNPSVGAASIGAAAWWVGSGIVAAFAGAFLTGRLSGKLSSDTGGWHGVTSWAATTLVIVYLVGSAAGGLLGGAASAARSALGGIGGAASGTIGTAVTAAAPAAAATPNPFGQIEQRVRDATSGQDPAAARDAAVSAIRAALTGDPSQAQAARDRAADTLARAQNIPVDQARTEIGQYETQYRQAVDTAKRGAVQAAEATAKAVSRAALLGAMALLLGAFAAWFGGSLGVRANRA